MSDSVADREKMYDDYVKYYNAAGKTIKDHISVLAEFSKIEEKVKERTRELHEMLQEALISVIDLIKSISDEGIDGKQELKKEVLNVLKFYEKNSEIHQLQINDLIYLEEKINKLFEGLEGKGQQLGIDLLIHSMESIIPKLTQSQNHKTVFWFLNGKIIDEHYPIKIEVYNELDDQGKQELSNGYVAHHNTRDGLVEDLEVIIESIQTKPRFFHSDGTIKHTTVAEYAVSQLWFAKKHGYGERGLHKHIKKISESMKSNTPS